MRTIKSMGKEKYVQRAHWILISVQWTKEKGCYCEMDENGIRKWIDSHSIESTSLSTYCQFIKNHYTSTMSISMTAIFIENFQKCHISSFYRIHDNLPYAIFVGFFFDFVR